MLGRVIGWHADRATVTCRTATIARRTDATTRGTARIATASAVVRIDHVEFAESISLGVGIETTIAAAAVATVIATATVGIGTSPPALATAEAMDASYIDFALVAASTAVQAIGH